MAEIATADERQKFSMTTTWRQPVRQTDMLQIGLHLALFLRATARSAKRVLAIVILSVRLSLCHDPVPIQAQMRQKLRVFKL